MINNLSEETILALSNFFGLNSEQQQNFHHVGTQRTAWTTQSSGRVFSISTEQSFLPTKI